ncbi:hypothetical protein ACKUB1_03040 [Methanospirillum stamsii]|uniref:hypothetical protein n=1 Tax=Methanospirillum stamsii TaxID=1277351 RepID=UPI0015E82E0F|nr:hypothetical protein [Methanospirillum stamsii]
MGGTGSHDSSEDGCSVILKYHTDTGELYNVGFKREKITVSSDEADSILTTIETWADTVNRPETNLFFPEMFTTDSPPEDGEYHLHKKGRFMGSDPDVVLCRIRMNKSLQIFYSIVKN